MILPIYAALERVSGSYLEASGDLGARPGRRSAVTLPLALPGVAAGSIFTFSLTLGDYIAPDIVGGNLHQFIGNVIFPEQGVAQNLPLAAAFAFVPIVIVILYLVVDEPSRRIRGAVDDRSVGHLMEPRRPDRAASRLGRRDAVPVPAAAS